MKTTQEMHMYINFDEATDQVKVYEHILLKMYCRDLQSD